MLTSPASVPCISEVEKCCCLVQARIPGSDVIRSSFLVQYEVNVSGVCSSSHRLFFLVNTAILFRGEI